MCFEDAFYESYGFVWSVSTHYLYFYVGFQFSASPFRKCLSLMPSTSIKVFNVHTPANSPEYQASPSVPPSSRNFLTVSISLRSKSLVSLVSLFIFSTTTTSSGSTWSSR